MIQEAQLEQANGQDTAPIVKYSPAEAEIAALREEFTFLAPDSPEGYEDTRKAIAVLRTHRTGIEKRRVELKAKSLDWGRRVDAEAKRLTGMIEDIEKPLKAAKALVDDEKERIRREVEEAEKARQAAIERAERDAEESRLKAIRDAEDARLAEERRALAIERARMEADRRKAGDEYAARMKAEREIRAENWRIDADHRAFQEKLEYDRRAVQAQKDRLERIEFEKAAAEKAGKEAAERLERQRAEHERLAKEKARMDAEEADRLAQARPDEEKIRSFGRELRAIPLPATKTGSVMGFMVRLAEDLAAIADRCEGFSVG